MVARRQKYTMKALLNISKPLTIAFICHPMQIRVYVVDKLLL